MMARKYKQPLAKGAPKSWANRASKARKALARSALANSGAYRCAVLRRPSSSGRGINVQARNTYFDVLNHHRGS